MAVNLSMLAGAGAQFFDNNGDPLSGGKLFTYTAGTTTPQATYTTNAGNVAHANPIVLDSAGRVPSGGEIWLTDTVNYKFVLQNATGTVIATYDNVAGNGSGIAAAFAASGGSALVGFLPAGSGAVATTVQSKLRENISAKDFGAAGNGITDDAATINTTFAGTSAKNTVDLLLSRVSVTPSKPSFDSGLAAFNSINWKQGLGVKYKGPTMENVWYSDFVSLPYSTFTQGVPVNESIFMAPYHPGIILDVKTPASYNNVAQATHLIGAAIGSTTQTATSFVFRKDGASETSISVRSNVPATASFTGTISGTTLTVSDVSGTIAIGHTVFTGFNANGVVQGTKIVGGSGSTWTVDISQTVSSQAMTSGVESRRTYEYSNVGTTYKMVVKDLTTGFISFNSERSSMIVPHEFGGQVDIATGTQVGANLSSFNTDPYLRLNRNNTFIGGLKIDSANTRLSMVIETGVAEGTAVLALPKNVGFAYASTYSGADSTAAAISIGKNSTSLRSLNATGNIKALQGVNGNTYTTTGRNALALAATDIGTMVFDTTLGKPVWLKNNTGPVWVDASGASV